MAIFRKRSINSLGEKKKDMPEGLWHKCADCGSTIHEIELKRNLHICPECDHHFLQTAWERIEMLTDSNSFKEWDTDLETTDPLAFPKYKEKIKTYKEKTKLQEAVITGEAKIGGYPVSLGVMDFRFLGGTMNSVVGEKITRAIERATAEKKGLILISTSGGARMYESMLSLMQMAKTSGALALHHQAELPYISVLTHPTTAGVSASFATLGDIIITEPKCMIGFAGPRVVKETTHQNLPKGFQTAEFMLEHGLVDLIVQRPKMRDTLIQLLSYLLPS